MQKFTQAIKERVLVADGALGTRLRTLTGNSQSCIDGFNLDSSYSEIVSLVHRCYVEAGSDIIFTNTYGANAIKLDRYARRNQVVAINEEGARLAKAAAQGRSYVAGSVGPVERPGGAEAQCEDILEEVFREQLLGLSNGGVDLFVFETFQDIIESRAAQ